MCMFDMNRYLINGGAPEGPPTITISTSYQKCIKYVQTIQFDMQKYVKKRNNRICLCKFICYHIHFMISHTFHVHIPYSISTNTNDMCNLICYHIHYILSHTFVVLLYTFFMYLLHQIDTQ